MRHELADWVRQMEEEAAKRGEEGLLAGTLDSLVMQRVAASAAAESTVSLVELPSDDVKGPDHRP